MIYQPCHHSKVIKKVNDEKGLKILSQNKLLTILLVLLQQIQDGKNSHKL